MPTAGGPNTLGESNLVFAYDTGDVSNSYKGAPTTNICTGADYSIYNDGATNSRNQTSPLPPVVGYEVVKVVANTPGTYGQSILWTATYSSTPTTATNSVYAWLESGTYVQVGQHWFPWNYGSPKYIEKGKWVRISETYAINEGGSYSQAAMVYSTDGVAYFCMPQYELKPYLTPFIGFLQTRSATQGLLPLIGNSTIDLSNVSFDSSAKMVFDGTNDYIYSSVTLGTEITLEIVIQSSNYSGNKIPISINGDAYSSGPNLYFTNNIIAWNTGNGDANPFSNSYYPNSNYHHIVVTNVFGGTAILYIDGIQIGTATSLNTTTTGANKLIIGDYHDGGYAISANIPITKLYNRALTAQEVKQNYQQYKTRFNLS